MKYIKIFLLTLVFAFILSGCGNKTESSIDYDLSTMNLEMKSATFEQILNNYKSNEGKTMKMDGIYYNMQADNGNTYHIVVFYDSTGCCPYSIEWVSKNETYPTPETEIVVLGTLETYTEEGDPNEYVHINNATYTTK